MIGFVVDPLLHVYELAPLAVNVADWPEQIDSEFTVILGLALMLTLATAVLVQPCAVVPVTVYEVFEVGETISGLAFAPVFQV
jgi:hypothetical protein